MSTSGSKSNEHVAHFLVDIHKEDSEYSVACLTELANLIEKELNDFFR